MELLRYSDRWPQDRFSTVQPAWEGETCCVIGGGPSLTQQDVDAARQCRVIAVNDAYLLAPWADVSYAADARWHAWHVAGVARPTLGLTAEQVRDRWAAFPGVKCSMENGAASVKDPAVHVLRNLGQQGLSHDPSGLMTGQHGGFQSINLAVLAGCKRILLLGFDMRNGRHFFGQHPAPTDDSEVRAWLASYQSIETPLSMAGITVINCSPGSALTRFPMMPIQEALASCAIMA